HLDCPRIECPVVDEHLHGRAGQLPHSVRGGGGADHDVHSPHQAPQTGPPPGPPNPPPPAGHAPTSLMFGNPALAIECSRLWAVSAWAEATPTRVPDGNWASRGGVSRGT